MIQSANHYVHIAAYVFDDEIRFSASGQHSNTPIWSRKSSYAGVPPALSPRSPEELNCPAPADRESVIAILRCTAARLAQINQQGQPPLSSGWETARGEVAVLVWNDPMDDSYVPPLTNLDDVGYVLVPVSDLWAWNTDVTLDARMRSRGSGESLRVLRTFREILKSNYPASSSAKVPMPTGIMVMQQKNNNALTSSHHQKLVVTDTGAHVGGDNFTKEFWDTDSHLPKGGNGERWTSTAKGVLLPSIPAYDDDGGPIHDTGAIVKGAAVAILNNIFLARWSTNIHNDFGVAVRTPTADLALPLLRRSTPFEPLRLALQSRFTVASNTAERRLERYVSHNLETQAWARSLAKTPLAAAGGPLASNLEVTVAKPSDSYQDPTSHRSTRGVYNTTIFQWMGNPGSFAYFENQFAVDHDFFRRLFQECVPREPMTPTWCHRDPFGFFVVPYQHPFPTELIAHFAARNIQEEMQNFIWMEVKTANGVKDRTTARGIVTFAIPPEPYPPCPHSDLTNGYPCIRFQNHASETDPSLVTIDSMVEMRSAQPSDRSVMVTSPLSPVARCARTGPLS